ncbi:L,D-transpeptidase family protein [bacterium]|jgi:L,D-peptidoglycan transpeptidase YkuD (ErfK/YbiS/YcfS/YnhG family)|nr:L,D-transpeptidase family protein [bacterium]
MIIYLKNKHTLEVDDFQFRCSIGKNGLSSKKNEGDFCTPKGVFKLENLFYRKDRINFNKCELKIKNINKNMAWCNDSSSIYYNKLTRINKKISYEKMFRKDYKYNFIIPLNYNRKKIKKNRGSAIFIHLTKDYKPTAGCIAINKNDFEILLKIIKKNTYIRIC